MPARERRSGRVRSTYRAEREPIKLSASARKSLARKKSLAPGALLVAKDAAGNPRSADVRIKLLFKR